MRENNKKIVRIKAESDHDNVYVKITEVFEPLLLDVIKIN